MNGKIEKLESKEQPTSRIILEFFRHGKREKTRFERKETQEEDEAEQRNLSLTPEGRKQGIEKGKKLHPQPEVAVAIGSPRRRAKEMAARVMLAEEEKITPEMGLEEMEKVIGQELKYGKKIIAEPRLDLYLDGPVGKKLSEAYRAGKTVEYMVFESDKDALNLKDKVSSTYSRSAGNFAEVIKKYVEIAKNFDRIVKNNPEKYVQYNNQMERYLGSHQGTMEGIITKIIEKVKGIEYRDEFIKFLGAGFKDGEGFRIEINNFPSGLKMEVKYKMGDKEEMLELPQEVLDEIIKGQDGLNRKIEEQQ